MSFMPKANTWYSRDVIVSCWWSFLLLVFVEVNKTEQDKFDGARCTLQNVHFHSRGAPQCG